MPLTDRRPAWRDLAWLGELGRPLLTDLYQLTMLRAYAAAGMHAEAVFEFFVRRLPEHCGLLLAAGLGQVRDYLETISFSAADLDWLGANGPPPPWPDCPRSCAC